MKLYFIADEHHWHENIMVGHFLGKPPHQSEGTRPFKDVREMSEYMIGQHNDVVTDPHDSLTIHIGDMFWKHCPISVAKDILSRLNGAHALVFGNHDEIAKQLLRHFQWAKERAEVKLSNGQLVILDHYAGIVWRNSCHGSWQLYGHSHGALEQLKADKYPDLLSLDVGVDCNNFRPLSEQDVMEKMVKQISKTKGMQ